MLVANIVELHHFLTKTQNILEVHNILFLGRKGLLPQLNQTTPHSVSDSITPNKTPEKGNLNKLSDLPTNLNWASQGKVTSVKNQGNCGTCWSFATVGAI